MLTALAYLGCAWLALCLAATLGFILGASFNRRGTDVHAKAPGEIGAQ